MSLDALRQNVMMAHLIDALLEKTDIGLVFAMAMVARHFLSEAELTALLQLNPGVTDHEARSLYLQGPWKGLQPPRRERIWAWQKEQPFPICPNPEDPDACNVYKDLKFPPEVYEHISGYYEGKAESSESRS